MSISITKLTLFAISRRNLDGARTRMENRKHYTNNCDNRDVWCRKTQCFRRCSLPLRCDLTVRALLYAICAHLCSSLRFGEKTNNISIPIII